MKNVTKGLLVIGIVLAGILSACTAASDPNQPVELVWYTIGTPQKDMETVNAKINEYTLEKINATVTIKQIDWGDYNNKMQVIVNSGEAYDIAFTSSWANDYLTNARKGAFMDISSLLDQYAPETKQAIDSRFWEGVTIDGKVYGVPTNKEIGVSPMWVFNKELVDKYNVPYQDIHSLEDLAPYLETIKKNEPDYVPLNLTNNFELPIPYDILARPLGINFADENMTVTNTFNSPEMEASLKTVRDYYVKGYIPQDAAINKDASNKDKKWFVIKADGQPYAEEIWKKDFGYEVVTSPIMDTYVTNASTTGSINSISSTSKNPEKAMEFLNLVNTDPYLRNLVNYGIEDVHYTKTGESSIKVTEEQKNYAMPYFALGNLFITYTLDGEPTDKWQQFEAFNNDSKTSPALGFKFDTTSVSTEMAAISNVLQEFGPALNTGSVDPNEYLPKMNEKLQAAGIEKVQAEMQKQLDAWKKSN